MLLVALAALVALAGCEGLKRGVYEGAQTRDRTGGGAPDSTPTVDPQPSYDQYREGVRGK